MRRALKCLNLYGREAVRRKLKNSLKTQQMHLLFVFEPTSNNLSNIYLATSMPFASINSINPRTNPWNFGGNCSAFGGGWKIQFFWVGHFEFFFQKKYFLFCFIPIKISHNLLDSKDFSKFWWLPWFPEKSGGCIEIWDTL